RYLRMGNRERAYRLRLATLTSPADSTEFRALLIQAIQSSSGAAARPFVDMLDATFAQPPSGNEELSIARALGQSGGDRGARAYSRAIAAGLGVANDHFQYASL